jgi:hypothetical protein
MLDAFWLFAGLVCILGLVAILWFLLTSDADSTHGCLRCAQDKKRKERSGG